MGTIDPELMRILVCPLTHAPLVELNGWLYSTDSATRRKYPIRDGIPIMLIEESRVAEVDEYNRVVPEDQRAQATTTIPR